MRRSEEVCKVGVSLCCLNSVGAREPVSDCVYECEPVRITWWVKGGGGMYVSERQTWSVSVYFQTLNGLIPLPPDVGTSGTQQ